MRFSFCITPFVPVPPAVSFEMLYKTTVVLDVFASCCQPKRDPLQVGAMLVPYSIRMRSIGGIQPLVATGQKLAKPTLTQDIMYVTDPGKQLCFPLKLLTHSEGDVLCFAVDLVHGQLWLAINGAGNLSGC